ncbi:hypothetical protein FSP39_013466 [Pinctada imbricata]|uniref:L-Fucosyltransferase n=1 Tax=Pinctada imbricata TaxID=66713 RepID=A0AA88XPA7_PINIB|nr:hypothetical protein FSP39_013466 [Pinctada imbricata]
MSSSTHDLSYSTTDLEKLCCDVRKQKAGTRYICPFYQGGLGNHMFQVASVYGISKIRGFSVGMRKQSVLYDYFRMNLDPLKDNTVCDKAIDLPQYRACAFDNETLYFEDDCKSNYHIEAYVQSWKYFESYKSDVLKMFTFKPEIVQKAQVKLRAVLHSRNVSNLVDSTIIGLHVRRGDFKTVNNTKYGYRVAGKDYIDRAMMYYRKRYKNTKFVLFVNKNKDDIAWCKENIVGDDVYLTNTSSPGIDLCAYSLCNHTIITVGSFGWWGSWLSKGTTVYYKDVASNGSSLLAMFSKDKTDYFYPGWIGL